MPIGNTKAYCDAATINNKNVSEARDELAKNEARNKVLTQYIKSTDSIAKKQVGNCNARIAVSTGVTQQTIPIPAIAATAGGKSRRRRSKRRKSSRRRKSRRH
jgi:hypothetical protein